MNVGKSRIAIPTKGVGGLEDVVSAVFGRANSFTVVDVEKGVVKNVKVLKNPAVTYQHGAGPIVVKMLIDDGVNTVVAAEFGPGVLTLLDHHRVTRVTVSAGTTVAQSIKELLSEVQK